MDLFENIFDNFDSVDLASNHCKQYLSRYLPGTCQWFLEHDSYRGWETERGRLLYLVGPPGVGKSTIASVVTERLTKKGWTIDSLLCEKEDTHAPEVLATRILTQIAEQVIPPDLPAVLSELETLRRGVPYEPGGFQHHADLNSIARKISTHLDGRRIGLIIDALDAVDAKSLYRLLEASKMLQVELAVNVFITSRYVDDATKVIQPTDIIRVRATSKDVMKYATTYLFPLNHTRKQDRKLQCEQIVAAAQGIFSFAVGLVFGLSRTSSQEESQTLLEHWNNCSDLSSVERLLDSTINKGDDDFFKVIHWMTHAARQLTMLELRHALSCGSDGKVLPLPSTEQVLALANGLLEVDEVSDLVSFFHPSAKEYIRRLPSTTWLAAGRFDGMIASACTTYLAHVAESDGVCLNADGIQDRLRLHPFLEYAARNWSFHAKGLPVESFCIDRILDDRLAAKVLGQTKLIMDGNAPPNADDMLKLIDTFNELELAAYLGLSNLVSNLVSSGFSVNYIDSYKRTPLYWAAVSNSKDVIRFLCARDTITLALLIKDKQVAHIRLLVNWGYRINTTDALRRTPLHLAIGEGLPEVAAMLIHAKADVNIRDIKGTSPLMLAMSLKDRPMVDRLLTNNADTKTLNLGAFHSLLSASFGDAIGIFMDLEEGNSCLRLASDQDISTAVRSRAGRCIILKHDIEVIILHFASSTTWKKLHFRGTEYSRELKLLNALPMVQGVYGHLELRSAEDEASNLDGGSWSYTSAFTLPEFRINDPHFKHKVEICWKVMYISNQEGVYEWKTTSHICNFSHHRIPRNGAEFFQRFLHEIREHWLNTCARAIHRLNTHLRANLLKWNGERPLLLEKLLKHGLRWTSERLNLESTVSDALAFALLYCERHDEGEYYQEILDASKRLSQDVSESLDRLESILRELLQLEFNLVSIKEARQSVTMSASMKRLTWITFIFLPLTFVATCFGMNIDILASNPAWWTYVPFATGTVLLTSTVWIIFKYSNLEQAIEKKVHLVLPRKKEIEPSPWWAA